MIELLPDMPQGVIGIHVSGRLSGDELRGFKPKIQELLPKGEIRIVEVIASDYEGFGPGGLAEDLKLGLGTVLPHYSAFKVAEVFRVLDALAPGRIDMGLGRSVAFTDGIRRALGRDKDPPRRLMQRPDGERSWHGHVSQVHRVA